MLAHPQAARRPRTRSRRTGVPLQLMRRRGSGDAVVWPCHHRKKPDVETESVAEPIPVGASDDMRQFEPRTAQALFRLGIPRRTTSAPSNRRGTAACVASRRHNCGDPCPQSAVRSPQASGLNPAGLNPQALVRLSARVTRSFTGRLRGESPRTAGRLDGGMRAGIRARFAPPRPVLVRRGRIDFSLPTGSSSGPEVDGPVEAVLDLTPGHEDEER